MKRLVSIVWYFWIFVIALFSPFSFFTLFMGLVIPYKAVDFWEPIGVLYVFAPICALFLLVFKITPKLWRWIGELN